MMAIFNLHLPTYKHCNAMQCNAMQCNAIQYRSLAISKNSKSRKALGNKSLNTMNSENFEDAFVDDVIGKLGNVMGMNKKKFGLVGDGNNNEQILSYDQEVNKENDRWGGYQNMTTKQTSISNLNAGSEANGKVGKRVSKYSSVGQYSSMVTAGADSVVRIVTDPTKASFEKNNKNVYGFKKDNEMMYSNPEQFPEVQEYMGWRLKRNKKRLARLDGASRIIQGAYRAHLAWLIVKKLRQSLAILYIQRCYRGWKGRLEFLDRMRLVWAAQIVQRNWRGHQGREDLMQRRIQSAAVTHVQRVFRGHVARKIVLVLHEARRKGACR